MNNKFGRAAILAGIAAVLLIFLGSVVNSLIYQLLAPIMTGTLGLFLAVGLRALESVVAFFLAVKTGSKLIFKKDAPTSRVLILSIVACVLQALACLAFLVVFGGLVGIINYIITFVVFFVPALIIDNSIQSVDSAKNFNPVQRSAPQQPGVVANEAMSVQAQYAFNQKLAEQKASANLIDDTVEAKLFAQAVELQLLKAPATAQFCALEEMTVTSTGNVFVVSGYVDSQNSYGAMVRTPFTITVFKENGNWKNADKFVSTSAAIQGKMISHTIVWWILGILGSIITFLVYYFIIYA